MNLHLDTIVFDLGGVLVELRGVSQMLEWCGGSLSEAELWRRWLTSPGVRRFESGQCDAAAFASTVVQEFALAVEPAQFLQAFAVWPEHLFPGARALLESLAPRFRLVSLSNTNAVHWQHVCHTLGLADCFQEHFPSHQTGRLKPDRETFEFVVQCLGAAPERMLFFDDNLANVETARSVGMHARRVSGVSETIAALRALQLIDVDAGPA